MQVVFAKRDAAFGWGKALSGEVHEDGAAGAFFARPCVVVEDDDEVVDVVVAPEMFGACRIGVDDRSVVVAVCGIVAPAVGPLDLPCGK